MSKSNEEQYTFNLGKYTIVENYNNDKSVKVSISKGDETLINCLVPLKSGCVDNFFDGYELFECSEMSNEQIADLLVAFQESDTDLTHCPSDTTFSAINYYLIKHLNYGSDSPIVKEFTNLSIEMFNIAFDDIDLRSSSPLQLLKNKNE